MAIIIQMMNPIPLVSFNDWNEGVKSRRKESIKKYAVAGVTRALPGGGGINLVKGIALFLAAASGVELIGMVHDVAPARTQEETRELIRKWLEERYGHVLKPRIEPRPKRGRTPKRDQKKITPFPFPHVDVDRTLEDVFRTKPTTDEDTDPESWQNWFERRFSGSILKFQRLRR